MSLLKKFIGVARKPSVGAVIAWKYRWQFGWRLQYVPDVGEYAGLRLDLLDLDEAQAVLTSSSADEALSAVAVLRDNWDMIPDEDDADADD